MNIVYLPSQLHLSYTSSVEIDVLQSIADELFPDLENSEVRDETLYLYEPNELIKFIHISKSKIGVIFSKEVVKTGSVESAWDDVEKLLLNLNPTKLKNYSLEVKVVKPFSAKKKIDQESKRLSPVKGFRAGSLTLYPDDDHSYFVKVSTVVKSKSNYGLMLNFKYLEPKLKINTVIEKLKENISEFDDIEKVEAKVNGILAL